MKALTLIAKLPQSRSRNIMRKLWTITSYLKDEVGVKVSLIITSSNGSPHLIVMDDVIDLNDDIRTILQRVLSKLSYDVGDVEFLDKVAAAAVTEG
ncbi:MAG: hypothetical protein DRO09_03960 [Thermoprotei archaeon]|nr:MAG: hypothetical protein DRO09_03960 [Thermoprotei archaeon]